MKKSLLFFLLAFVLTTTSCTTKENPTIKNNEAVILIHGFGRSETSMWYFKNKLEEAGYGVKTVGYSSLNQDMDGIKKEVYTDIDSQDLSNYKKVHFVGHSLGGLLVRSYLGEKKIENLGNVVIMGSPNKGTPAVDVFKNKWWFSLLGPAVKELGTSGTKFLTSLKKPYYNLGAIAGDSEIESYEYVLKGADDGLVTVESAKVEGMRDFIVLDSSHTMMRYNKSVIKQTIYFLKKGKFLKNS
ncbi:MAG: hypothetical protein OIF32_07230 [Campylobacterales bacterium]|nr:hypothetical protein [Campylobacterales bacterium]